jgi:hypothetical protein
MLFLLSVPDPFRAPRPLLRQRFLEAERNWWGGLKSLNFSAKCLRRHRTDPR